MVSTDTASHVVDDIPPDLLAFIKDNVNSFAKWDLLRFFHHNPYAQDHIDNLARHVGRDKTEVQRELDSLVTTQALVVRVVADITVYAPTKDDNLRDLMARFFQACDDKVFRSKVIGYVIELEAVRPE